MQFQAIADIDPDGVHAKQRMRAFVMSNGGWGLPLYENEYVKEDGVWKIKLLHGPFTMYTSWDGWAKSATPNTRPDTFGEPPDLPPTVVYLTYPSYYIVPFHYPNPVTGKPWSPRDPAGRLPMLRRARFQARQSAQALKPMTPLSKTLTLAAALISISLGGAALAPAAAGGGRRSTPAACRRAPRGLGAGRPRCTLFGPALQPPDPDQRRQRLEAWPRLVR